MLQWLRNFFTGKTQETTPVVVPAEKPVVVDVPENTKPLKSALDVNNDGKVDIKDAKETVKRARTAVKSKAVKATKGITPIKK